MGDKQGIMIKKVFCMYSDICICRLQIPGRFDSSEGGGQEAPDDKDRDWGRCEKKREEKFLGFGDFGGQCLRIFESPQSHKLSCPR